MAHFAENRKHGLGFEFVSAEYPDGIEGLQFRRAFRSSGQAHVRDAVFAAGGLTTEAWEESAQLFRNRSNGTTKVFNISLRDALAGDPLNNILVEPRDRILVHRQPQRVNPPNVYVRGEVARPGKRAQGAESTRSWLRRYRLRVRT
jgi:protein involved in polysaccharide export with SLBB domain